MRIAADLVFGADSSAAEASGRANDRLEKAHHRFEESVRPPGRSLPPYTPPDEELYVEVPDCAPPEDPLTGVPADEWRLGMAPPSR